MKSITPRIAKCYFQVNSKLRIASQRSNRYHSGMTVKELRQAKLKRLIVEKAGGKQRLFAETYGFNAAYLSQMCTGHRDIGDKTARKIEKALKLPVGWMDSKESTTATDALWTQLERLYGDLSADSRDELVRFANYLHAQEYPQASPANPYGKRKKTPALN